MRGGSAVLQMITWGVCLLLLCISSSSDPLVIPLSILSLVGGVMYFRLAFQKGKNNEDEKASELDKEEVT